MNRIDEVSDKASKDILHSIVDYIVKNPKILKDRNTAEVCRKISRELDIEWSLPYEIEDNNYEQTFTLTFGDQGENHAGMKKIGEEAEEGFSLRDLKRAQKWFDKNMISNEIIYLNRLLEDEEMEVEADDAWILVARNGLSAICDCDEFYEEQDELEKDRKALMRGKVVNKHARANLCFSNKSQKAEYEKGKGTIVAWKNVPLLNNVRQTFPEIIGEKGGNLIAEGNYYEEPKTSYIGWHGDGERKKVIAVRVGATMNLCYQWFYKSKIIGEKLEIFLNHGDIYIMSEKAVGTDWKKRNIPTLRHAAGAEKYLKYKPNWLANEDQDQDYDEDQDD